MALADAIAAAVNDAYNLRVSRPGKPQAHEWTCLAGVVAEVQETGLLSVIALATGNKCLGRGDLRSDGNAVNDCHAEVLARRTFNRALLDEIAWHRAHCMSRPECVSPTHCHTGILAHDESAESFSLRPGVRLHLYISDAPCGAAAEVTVAVSSPEADACGGAAEVAAGPRKTGAKMITGSDALAGASSSSSLRLKPGRGDLPEERRTRSMCCSDKACRWVALGLGGSLLRWWVPAPLRLASIVVSLEAPDPRVLDSGLPAPPPVLLHVLGSGLAPPPFPQLAGAGAAALAALTRALRERCEPECEAAWRVDVGDRGGIPAQLGEHWPSLAVVEARFLGGRTETTLRRATEAAAAAAAAAASHSDPSAAAAPDPSSSSSSSSRKRPRYGHASGGSGSGALAVPCPTAVTALLDWARMSPPPPRAAGGGLVTQPPPLRLPGGPLSCEALQATTGTLQGRSKSAAAAAARSRVSKAALLRRFLDCLQTRSSSDGGAGPALLLPPGAEGAATVAVGGGEVLAASRPYRSWKHPGPPPGTAAEEEEGGAAACAGLPPHLAGGPASARGVLRYQAAKAAFHGIIGSSSCPGGGGGGREGGRPSAFAAWLHGDPALEEFS